MESLPSLEAPPAVAPLLHAAADFAQVAPAVAGKAARAVLGLTGSCVMPEGRSQLNWNGSPLQLLISLREDRATIRLLGDPIHDLTDPVARYETGRKALRAASAFADAPALRAAAESTLELAVSRGPATPGACHLGSVFVGVALGAPGAALYLSPATRIGRCEVARDWVAGISPAPDAAAALLARVATRCFLVGFGIEGGLPGSLRMKVYWRMTGHVSLHDFGVPLLLDSDMAGFVDWVLAGGSSPEALIFSAAFDLVTGTLRDVKVDASWHDRSFDEGLALLDSRLAALGARLAQKESIRDHDLGIACIGAGIDAAGGRRINAYLFQT